MNLPISTQAIRSPGLIIINPQNVTTAPDYGGTILGLTKAAVIDRRQVELENTAEEYGGESADKIYLSESWALAFKMRGWVNSAIEALFPNTTTHEVTKKSGIVHPGSSRSSGESLSSDKVSLLFVPTNTDNYAYYFRFAIPALPESMKLPLGLSRELEIDVGFKAYRDPVTPEESVQIRLIDDIEL